MSRSRFGNAPSAPDYAARAHWSGIHRAPDDFAGELVIARVPLDSSGYTRGKRPRYFGVGAPLFHVENLAATYHAGIEIDFYLRAANGAAARAAVRRMYPHARIR